MNTNVLIILPTRNPGDFAQRWIQAEKLQDRSHDVLVIDSDSSDGSQHLFKNAGYRLKSISPSDFNHGGTRQLGVELSDGYDFLIYMTQDALLKDKTSIDLILQPFSDEQVAAVCGRQVPHLDANPIAFHAREFNYPAVSHVYGLQDIPRVGIKAAFLSDSFAAYRRTALQRIGGFPQRVIFGEDFQVACKLLKAGMKVAYASEAQVYHSHNYSPVAEFRRYFDAGVSHRLDYWMIEMLGSAGGEGIRFAKSELKFLMTSHPAWLPRSLLHNFFKYFGYRMGLNFELLSTRLRKRLSFDRRFWEKAHQGVLSL